MILFSVSEEWKIKKERKKDRERIDSNGHAYGYSDKGSLHFPMINNGLDDIDIILGTSSEWFEEGYRGSEKFTPG